MTNPLRIASGCGQRWVMAAHKRGLVLAAVTLMLFAASGQAQTRFTYSKGQSVSPAFEGWWQNDDGTYALFFGYMNSNWEQEFDVPVGPENARGNPRISIPAATCSCSRSRYRPILAAIRR